MDAHNIPIQSLFFPEAMCLLPVWQAQESEALRHSGTRLRRVHISLCVAAARTSEAVYSEFDSVA